MNADVFPTLNETRHCCCGDESFILVVFLHKYTDTDAHPHHIPALPDVHNKRDERKATFTMVTF